MKGTSEVIMGATLIMAATLAIVLGLVVVLLAELYCSLLLRRRRPTICNPDSSSTPATPVATASPASNNAFQPDHDRPPATSPLSSFYSHGVLRAPRSLLFPALSYPESDDVHHYLRHAHPPTTEFVSVTVPEHDSDPENHLMYISNPVYDAGGKSGHLGTTTPFETPDSSPSRLEEAVAASSSSPPSDHEADHKRVEQRVVEVEAAVAVVTPPVTPMKKLPAMACSVALRDVRSLCTSCSDTNTNLGLLSSSSGTPSTSPSW